MASPNCLAGCVSDFLCSTLDPTPQAESFAPWCWVQLSEGGTTITVGNSSYAADPNTAIVKSLEVGWTDKPLVKVEIVDEDGGNLGVVMDSLAKCAEKRQGLGTSMRFQFGWVELKCGQGYATKRLSPIFLSMINQFEVSYAEGKIKYSISATSYDAKTNNMREDIIYGDEKYPTGLEDAIALLCSKPPAMTVRYVERQPDGKLKDIKFEWAKTNEQPLGIWQSDNQNRLSTIMRWIGPFRIKDGKCDKGIIPFFSPDKPDELVLMKDPQLQPFESKSCGNDNLGTYIVNGGKCSTVIEFNPTANFLNALNQFTVGGDTSGPNKSSNQFTEDKRCGGQEYQGQDTGTQTQATITQQAFDVYGTKTANEENLKSEMAHNKANLFKIDKAPITAELKILGNPDPKFCEFKQGTPISIVVINPFRITGSGCGDWLAKPGCNPIFSNKQWIVQSINHAISPGSYTTTLKVMLNAPNVHLAANEPLGGTGSGGTPVEGGCR